MDRRHRWLRTPGAIYFFTVVTEGRRPFLCESANVALIRETFHHQLRLHPFTVEAIVLLLDHIHTIWTLPEADSDFSSRWQQIKRYFSRSCGDPCKREVSPSRRRKAEQAVWQRRFWEHQIRDERDFAAHLDDVHFNPVKHGLVSSVADWPFSSFHRFASQGLYPRDWVCRGIEFADDVGRK